MREKHLFLSLHLPPFLSTEISKLKAINSVPHSCLCEPCKEGRAGFGVAANLRNLPSRPANPAGGGNVVEHCSLLVGCRSKGLGTGEIEMDSVCAHENAKTWLPLLKETSTQKNKDDKLH